MRPLLRPLFGGVGGGGASAVPAFSDDFERADTADGSIGSGWVLKAPYVASYPLPASAYGKIVSGQFTADASRIVYAQRELPWVVRRIKATCSWVANPAFDGGQGVTGAATAAFIVSGNGNLVEDMGIHVIVPRAGSAMFQRRYGGGSFTTLGTITQAQHQLMANGNPFNIETWVLSNGDWGLTVNGFTVTGNDSTLNDHLTGLCAWEVYHNGANHVDLVRFESVEARAA